jgi:retron-type reverse transcriptase
MEALTRERERERESKRWPIHAYDYIISIDNLLGAWREFSADKKKRQDVLLFSRDLLSNISCLHRDLADKTYRHGQYQAFKINDPKPRDIHKASVRDRLVHHALYRVLYYYFDQKFIYDSYSCRLGKGTHRAMNRFRDYGRKVSRNQTRTTWVLKGDIRKFFANIDHRILFKILEKYIGDKEMLGLLEEIIGSFATSGRQEVGLPLGNLTSQLLVNIYMNKFDHFVKRDLKIKYYIRYADDFVILSKDGKYLENLLPAIKNFLADNLKLKLHPDKVYIKTLASGVDFLGWVHFSHHRVLRTSTKRRMFKRQEEAPGNLAVFASYWGLLGHGDAYRLKKSIKEIKSRFEN